TELAVRCDAAFQQSLRGDGLFIHGDHLVLFAPLEIGELLLDGIFQLPAIARARVIHAAPSLLGAEKVGEGLVVLQGEAARLGEKVPLLVHSGRRILCEDRYCEREDPQHGYFTASGLLKSWNSISFQICVFPSFEWRSALKGRR